MGENSSRELEKLDFGVDFFQARACLPSCAERFGAACVWLGFAALFFFFFFFSFFPSPLKHLPAFFPCA